MKDNAKKGIIILLHALFWVVISYFFYHYSFLRPVVADDRYKELISVVLIILMVYVNYLYLIPKYFQTGRFTQFWFLSIFTVLLAGISEFFMVMPDMLQCFEQTLSKEIQNHFLYLTAFLIQIRYFCFFLFCFLLRLYQDVSKELLLEKQTMAKNDKTIYVNQIGGNLQEVKIFALVYISQLGNRTRFHLANNTVYEQYSSLHKTEEILPEGTFLRISKSYIVMLSQITGFDDRFVRLNLYENDAPLLLEISLKYKEKILLLLEKHLKSQKNKNVGENVGKNIVDDSQNPPKMSVENASKKDVFTMNHVQEKIFAYISEHPGCNAIEIAKNIPRVKRTIERNLSDLKKYGLIKFEGSLKYGGYFVIEKKSEN